jgi:predicted transcriptional regulator
LDNLPGPEKPLDWVKLLKQELAPSTASRSVHELRIGKRVRPRHRIAIMLQEAGWKNKDIASALGYTQARLSVILNSHHPELQEIRAGFASRVADNVEDLHTRFALYANEMLDVLLSHARNKVDRPELSRLAARDVLHMAGFTPVKKSIVMEGKLPQAELVNALDKLAEANEVALQSDQWKVKSA